MPTYSFDNFKKYLNEEQRQRFLQKKQGVKKEETKAFVYSHLGLGDMFWMNGAVRYLSCLYDIVVIVCKKQYEKEVRRMYKDDKTIDFFLINDDNDIYPFIQIFKPKIEQLGFRVYSCGYFTEHQEIYEFPLSFYDDFGINRDIRQDFFYVESTEEGKERYEKIKSASPKDGYIVFHQEASHTILDISSKFDKDKYLLLDLNKNLYPENHPFYTVANLVVNQPLDTHIQLLEGAKEIHMIESSVYCMTSHLDLSKVLVKKCYKPFQNSNLRLGIFETGEI
jgi:hypothetical protein